MTTKRSLRSWPRSSISLKTSIIGSDFIQPLATCRRLSLKRRFHHQYFLNYLCHFRGSLQSFRQTNSTHPHPARGVIQVVVAFKLEAGTGSTFLTGKLP